MDDPVNIARVAALTAAFLRLGFNAGASAILADRDREGLTIDALQYFDDKGVQDLCSGLRRPGGVVEGMPLADGALPPRLINPGVNVSALAKMNLSSACYMARHYRRTGRRLTAGDLTMEMVQRYAQFRTAEEDYKEPTTALKLIKPDKIFDFIDDWPEHLALYDGQGARPLAYVIRDIITIPPHGVDPPFGEVNSAYASLRDEIMVRAEHGTSEYHVDNSRVFEILNDAVSDHKNVKTWIKPYANMRDGRGAWTAFKAHYRGSAEMEAIETAAEHKLETIQYRGEKQRHSFETHVSMQMKCHLELEKATGTPIPELRKVRLLLKSLQVATMSVPAATIRAQTDIRGSFDASVNYLRSFLATTVQDSRTIAAFDGEVKPILPRKGKNPFNKNKNHKKNPGDSKALDRYYKPADWWQLDQSTRDKVLAMRKKRTISEVTAKEDTQDSDATTQRKPPGKAQKIENT
jgi:hypothetical protein